MSIKVEQYLEVGDNILVLFTDSYTYKKVTITRIIGNEIEITYDKKTQVLSEEWFLKIFRKVII